MNILIVNYEYPPIGAGAANAAYNISKQLDYQGHKVFVITSCFKNLKGWSEEENIEIFRSRCIRLRKSQSNMFEMFTFVLSAFWGLINIISKKKIEGLIVFFSLPCGPLGVFAKYIFGTPYIISLRGGDVPGTEDRLEILYGLLKPIRRAVLKNSISNVANSNGLKEMSECADPYSVKVIPNGVDTSFFSVSKKMVNKNAFLFVGRFQHQKNLFFLLEQMEIIYSDNKYDFELHFIGSGPLEKSLIEYSANLKIHDLIFWNRWCEKGKLRSRYQKACCFINPSLYEGMPNTLLEAMACGLPVIASDIAGNNELVIHGETGFLFDLDKPEDFRDAIVTIIENRKLACNMGRKGRLRAEKEFSWSRVAKKYVELLKIH